MYCYKIILRAWLARTPLFLLNWTHYSKFKRKGIQISFTGTMDIFVPLKCGPWKKKQQSSSYCLRRSSLAKCKSFLAAANLSDIHRSSQSDMYFFFFLSNTVWRSYACNVSPPFRKMSQQHKHRQCKWKHWVAESPFFVKCICAPLFVPRTKEIDDAVRGAKLSNIWVNVVWSSVRFLPEFSYKSLQVISTHLLSTA